MASSPHGQRINSSDRFLGCMPAKGRRRPCHPTGHTPKAADGHAPRHRMISIPEFTKFEQPLSLMKVPEDSQVSRLQSWKLPKQEMAETLFAVLRQTLHGDISSGPVVITKKHD